MGEALASGEVYMPQDQDFTLTEEVLQGAVSTTCVTEDGQNVIIIVAPPSPAHSNVYTSDTDPEWVPSPASSVSPSSPLRTISSESRGVKKKYQRKKPPTPPVGPYPLEKKERKKAQNRTAAFRYREKKKSEQEMIDDELELLTTKNGILKDKLTEMETEFRYLKKLMTEAGLGRYAQTVHL